MKVFTEKKKEEETPGYSAPEPLFSISLDQALTHFIP